jgi:outer membrane receptor protein involved in Fe transport
MEKVSGLLTIWTITGVLAAAECRAETLAASDPTNAIPPQSLATALQVWAQQTGWQLMYDPAVAVEQHSNGAPDGLRPIEALARVLDGTGLVYGYLNERTISILPFQSSKPSSRAYPAVLLTDNDDNVNGKNLRLARTQSQSSTANAQDDEASRRSNSESSSTQNAGITEVLVTAQKRETSILATPLSVTALGTEEIDRRGLVGMSDYLRTLPGVSQIDRGAGRNSVIIRGTASSPQTEGADVAPTVGIYLEDIPLTGYTNTGDSADIKLIDMERVEVLRGPQGTLYGDSSLGGTVRNIPNPPNLGALEGKLNIGLSSTERGGDQNNFAQGVANIPLIEDKLAIRAVGYRFDNSGYVRNVAASDPAFVAAASAFGVGNLAVNDDSVGDEKYSGGRVAALWKATDTFNAKFTYITQDLTQDGLPDVQLNLPGKYQQMRLRLGDVAGGGRERLADDVDIVNLELEQSFSWASLFSSTSHIDEKSLQNRDIGSFFAGIPVPQLITQDADVFVQEVRLTSKLSGPLQFLVGLYYQDTDKDLTSNTLYGGEASLNPFGTDSLLLGFEEKTSLEQKAVFGEVSYDITHKFTLTAGGRWFDYERVTNQVQNAGLFAGAPAAPLVADEKNSIFKLNGSYRPTEETMLYAQWSEGFRLGRAISPIPLATCDQNGDGLIDGIGVSIGARQLDADTLDSYEVGAKARLLDRRVVVSSAVYRNNWRGLPIGLIAPCGATAVVNAGEARTQGLEVESEFLVTDALRVSLGGSYVDAQLTKDAPGLGFSGDRLPGSPKFNVNSSLTYGFDVGGNSAFVRTDYAYVGGYYNNLQETGLEIGNYNQVNLRTGISLNNFQLEIYGNNLTDAANLTWTDTIFGGVDDRAVRLRPRTVGVTLGYTF